VSGRDWAHYGWGFIAGAVLASYVALSCGPTQAQSQEVATAIAVAAERHGVSEAWLRRVSWCESRWTPWVTSRGGHRGLFQFADRTWGWMSQQAGWAGASPYDPWAAADVAAWAFSRGMSGHWACR
jgi:soluble lytic murein transglycosylase-like protein